MSETERRRSYAESRVLISSDAILTTTFDDGDLYFTGEQIELMRNLIQYANRIDSYVAEYEPGYYLTPDDSDWDDIQAIVADLEETLMGNPNTLWGYGERVAQQIDVIGSPAGDRELNTTPVPSGHVQRIKTITVLDSTSAVTAVILKAVNGTFTHFLDVYAAPAANALSLWKGDYVLAYGDYIQATFYGCTLGDNLYLQVNGYEMNVP